MKHQLMRRPLRFSTYRAYDPLYAGPGKYAVERSVEEYSIDEPIDAQLRTDANASALPDPVCPACANPLSDEPDPAVVTAVKRFGIVGLVTCALCSGVLHWWKSVSH